MMKAALHRSITFWSGILMMAFIFWAWWDSFRHEANAGAGFFSVGNVNGGLVAGVFPGAGIPPNATYLSNSFSLHPDWDACQPPLLLRGTGEGLGDPDWQRMKNAHHAGEYYPVVMKMWPANARALFLPHWLVLLVVDSAWMLLLVWRGRRMKRRAIDET